MSLKKLESLMEKAILNEKKVTGSGVNKTKYKKGAKNEIPISPEAVFKDIEKEIKSTNDSLQSRLNKIKGGAKLECKTKASEVQGGKKSGGKKSGGKKSGGASFYGSGTNEILVGGIKVPKDLDKGCKWQEVLKSFCNENKGVNMCDCSRAASDYYRKNKE